MMHENNYLAFVSNAVEQITDLAGVPCRTQQLNNISFFADSENNIFVHLRYDRAMGELSVSYYLRIREGYESIAHIREKASKISAALDRIFNIPNQFFHGS